jgi:outer membrane protein assembly factor BamD (BamD/ComL family)
MRAAILAAAALLTAGEGWEYRPGIGFVNLSTMEKKSPTEFLDHARARRRAGEHDAALEAFSLLAAHAPEAAHREAAHFERAETFFEAGRFYEAYQDAEAFLARYPQSDRAGAAKRLEMSAAFEMARRGHKERVLGVPLISTSRTGIECLREALRRYPREEFTADFIQKLGMFYYDRGDYDAAEQEFATIVGNPERGVQAQYPDSPEAVLALYMLGRTSEQRFQGIARDIRPLREARRHYERFLEEADRLRRLPEPAARWVDGLLGPVRERLAEVYSRMLEKQLRTAEYYDWKGFPRSAAIYYRSILKDEASFRRMLKDFPETTAARKAREFLRSLAADAPK